MSITLREPFKTADALSIIRIDSPIGPLIAGATVSGIFLLEFADLESVDVRIVSLQQHYSITTTSEKSPHLIQLQDELDRYFAGTLKHFEVSLQLAGSDFQCKVWQQLRRIPYGETRSYEDIAIAVGSPKAVRAVGTANGSNRIAIVIPCHRVINKGGKLGGYGGGLDRKKILLELERR